MEAKVVAQIRIASDEAGVFRYLTTLQYHFLWNPHLQKIAPLTTLQLGTIYRTTSLFLNVKVSSKNIVTRFVSGKELEIQNRTGTLQYCVHYRLNAKNGYTIIKCTTKVTAKSNAFAFAKPVLKLLAQRELQSDLKALKIAVEQQLE